MFKKIKAFLFKLKLKRKGISMADLGLMVLNQKLLEKIQREEYFND